MTLIEVDEATNRVRKEIDPESLIIFGSTFDASLEDAMRVTVTATGLRTPAPASAPAALPLFGADDAV